MSSNIHEIAVSAAFMGMGFATASIKQAEATGPGLTHGWGQLETVAVLAEWAERLELLYCSLAEDIRDSAPGVWAYEVAEPMGVWFGEQTAGGGVPSKKKMDAHLAEVVADFFTQCDGTERPATKAALLSVITAELAKIR